MKDSFARRITLAPPLCLTVFPLGTLAYRGRTTRSRGGWRPHSSRRRLRPTSFIHTYVMGFRWCAQTPPPSLSTRGQEPKPVSRPETPPAAFGAARRPSPGAGHLLRQGGRRRPGEGGGWNLHGRRDRRRICAASGRLSHLPGYALAVTPNAHLSAVCRATPGERGAGEQGRRVRQRPSEVDGTGYNTPEYMHPSIHTAMRACLLCVSLRETKPVLPGAPCCANATTDPRHGICIHQRRPSEL